MLVSALSRDARRAMGANLLLMLVLIGIPGACAAALAFVLPGQRFYPQLLLSCPLYSLYLSDDSTYRLQPSHFWWSVAIVHGLTWLLLIVASWAVRHSWQDRPEGKRIFSWKALVNSLKFGPLRKRAQYRKRLLDINPFFWLAARAKYKPLHVWGVLLFVAGWWIWEHLQFGSIWLDERASGTDIATAIMLNTALKLWIGLEAGRQLAEERQSGSFELLLSTPITIGDIVAGQRLALKRQFLAPIILGAAVTVYFMIAAIRHSIADHGMLLTAWVGGLLMFGADVAALFWTAMYCALTRQSPNQTSVSTISRIVIAPSVIFGAVMVLLNLYAYLLTRPGPRLEFEMAWWFGLGLATDIVYGLSARRQLLSRFRQLASHTRAGGRPDKN
jgi:hypothetical protein